MTIPPARPTTYKGIQMRSRLEARFAQALDEASATWAYEPQAFADETGQYLPDFQVTGIVGAPAIYIEVKPTQEAAEAAWPQLLRIWSSDPAAELWTVWTEDLPDDIIGPGAYQWHSESLRRPKAGAEALLERITENGRLTVEQTTTLHGRTVIEGNDGHIPIAIVVADRYIDGLPTLREGQDISGYADGVAAAAFKAGHPDTWVLLAHEVRYNVPLVEVQADGIISDTYSSHYFLVPATDALRTHLFRERRR